MIASLLQKFALRVDKPDGGRYDIYLLSPLYMIYVVRHFDLLEYLIMRQTAKHGVLLLVAGCWHTNAQPDRVPSNDIPTGIIVIVTACTNIITLFFKSETS